jgi:hypothetical protein
MMMLTASTKHNSVGGFDAVVRHDDGSAVTTIGSFKSRHDAYKAAQRLRDDLLMRAAKARHDTARAENRISFLSLEVYRQG